MPPPAQCTIQASRMMARTIRTSHTKNHTIPGMAYPLTVLVLATPASYPPMPELIDRLTGLNESLANTAKRAKRVSGWGANPPPADYENDGPCPQLGHLR